MSLVSARVAVVALGQSAGKLTQLVVALLLVRLFSPAEWATTALLLSVYTAASGLGTLSIQQSLIFFLPGAEPRQKARLLRECAVLLAASGLGTAAIVAGALPRLIEGAYGHADAFVWLGLALGLEIPSSMGGSALLADAKSVEAGSLDGTFAVLQVGAVFVPAFAGLGPVGIAQGLCLYAAMRLTAVGCLVRRIGPGPADPMTLASLRKHARHAAPLALALAVGVLTRHVDKWLVAALATDEFGAYAVASQEVPFVSVLPYAVSATLAARLSLAFKAGDRRTVLRLWLEQTGAMSSVVVPATMLVVVCAPELVPWLFTKDYTAAVLPFQVYSLITLHRVAEYGLVLRAQGENRGLLLASVWLLVLNLVLGVPLVVVFGAVGAATAALLSNIGAWVYILAAIARSLDVGLRRAFPWRTYVEWLGIAAFAAVSAVIMSRTAGVESRMVSLFVKAVTFSLTSFTLLVARRALAWRRQATSRLDTSTETP